jgi:hypothetical protein
MNRTVGLGLVMGLVALPVAAYAHNLGHIIRPDGSCMEIGSGREAPLVGKDRTQLDLVPQTPNPPRDEYGVSFVGYESLFGDLKTSILPGPCPASSATASASLASASAAPAGTAAAVDGKSATPPASSPSRGLHLRFGGSKEE